MHLIIDGGFEMMSVELTGLKEIYEQASQKYVNCRKFYANHIAYSPPSICFWQVLKQYPTSSTRLKT
jgi:hypothetical protein